jgi:hypothetical protein
MQSCKTAGDAGMAQTDAPVKSGGDASSPESRQTEAAGEEDTPRKIPEQTGQKVWKTAKGFPSTIPRLKRGARRGNRNAVRHGAYTAVERASRRMAARVLREADAMLYYLANTRKARTGAPP